MNTLNEVEGYQLRENRHSPHLQPVHYRTDTSGKKYYRWEDECVSASHWGLLRDHLAD